MKNILMSSQFGLAFMRSGTALSFGCPVVLADGPAARLRQDIQLRHDTQLQRETSAWLQIQGSRPFALAAFAVTGVKAVQAPEAGDYAPTKHTGNGGSRGPHPWRRPPVIT